MAYIHKLLKCTYRDKLRFTICFTVFIDVSYFFINLFNNYQAINFKDIWIITINSFIFSALLSIATSQYKDFKISMQLGFSRSTLWKSRLIELTLQSIMLIVYILSVIKVQEISCDVPKTIATFCSVVCVTWIGLSTI